jgi:hypothetical protein
MKSRRHIATQRRTGRAREKGMAFVLALFTVGTLLVAASTALLVGSADIRATRNYRQAAQAHFVAEAGVAHAMQVINGPGVINFQNDVVNNWGTVFGAGRRRSARSRATRTSSGLRERREPAGAGTLRATSNGPEGVHNVVVASIVRLEHPEHGAGRRVPRAERADRRDVQRQQLPDQRQRPQPNGTPGPNPPVPASRRATTRTRRKRSRA